MYSLATRSTLKRSIAPVSRVSAATPRYSSTMHDNDPDVRIPKKVPPWLGWLTMALSGSRDRETKEPQEDPTQNLLTHPERTRLEPASRQRIRGRSEGKHVCFHLVFAAANVDWRCRFRYRLTVRTTLQLSSRRLPSNTSRRDITPRQMVEKHLENHTPTRSMLTLLGLRLLTKKRKLEAPWRVPKEVLRCHLFCVVAILFAKVFIIRRSCVPTSHSSLLGSCFYLSVARHETV